MNACPVTITLYKCALCFNIVEFGVAKVAQIYNEKTVPATPAIKAKIK